MTIELAHPTFFEDGITKQDVDDSDEQKNLLLKSTFFFRSVAEICKILCHFMPGKVKGVRESDFKKFPALHFKLVSMVKRSLHVIVDEKKIVVKVFKKESFLLIFLRCRWNANSYIRSSFTVYRENNTSLQNRCQISFSYTLK